MEKMPIDILFTGLLRKSKLFRKSINSMVKLQKQRIIHKIFLSTWNYEIENNPEIINFLNENSVIIIKNKEPHVKGPFNIWCQMKALDVGLQHIKSKFVLKTRTDVYINPGFIRKLSEEKRELLEITKDLPKRNIFKYKIWVPFYELKTIFHLADICFFGHHDDLKHLINYNKDYDTKYNVGAGISHIRRFIHPFLNDYPILYKALEKGYVKNGTLKSIAITFSRNFLNITNIKMLRRLGKNYKLKIFKKRLKDKIFVECLAAYYSILYSHFYIDNRSIKDQIIFRKKIGPKLNPINIEKNFTPQKYSTPFSGEIYGYDMDLLNNIINKKLEKTSFSIKLMKAIDKFQHYGNRKVHK